MFSTQRDFTGSNSTTQTTLPYVLTELVQNALKTTTTTLKSSRIMSQVTGLLKIHADTTSTWEV